MFFLLHNLFRGVANGGDGGGGWGGAARGTMPPRPTSTSEPKQVQQFQFQPSEILFFMGVQKFHGFHRVCYNSWTIYGSFHFHLIFSNYIREIDHSTLDLLKRSDT